VCYLWQIKKENIIINNNLDLVSHLITVREIRFKPKKMNIGDATGYTIVAANV